MDMILKFCLLLASISCEARVITHRRLKLSLAEPPASYYYRNINGVPNTYSFGYDIMDPSSGGQFRNEERFSNGTVVGSYGYMDPDGTPHRFKYIADELGYRVSRLQSKPVPPQPARLSDFEPYVTESSITWSRKKRPAKKKIADAILIKKPYREKEDDLVNRKVFM